MSIAIDIGCGLIFVFQLIVAAWF